MSLNRRQAMKAITAGAVGTLLSSCGTGQRDRRSPNILFVMTDDHSYKVLSCYGNTILKTPNLDRLATEGIRFTNSFVTNSLCAPARASVLTGCYSHVTGIRGNSQRDRINPSLPTFPQLLQGAGYRSGIVGKWHLGHEPAGFDYSCVLPGQGLYFDPDLIENGTRKKFPGYASDIITDLALKFLDETSREQPFCLLYQQKAPHRPFKPAPRHARLLEGVELPYPETYDDDYAGRRVAKDAHDMRLDVSLAGDYEDLPKGLSPKDRKNWLYNRFVKDYYAAVHGIDENLGRVLDYLDQNNLAQDTVVIYTSDNGFFLGEHGWYDKRFMYEPSLRVPLLIRYPHLGVAGKIEESMTVNVDYAPTILDLAGVTVPEGMQGRSLRPLLEGKPPADWRRSIYYSYYEYNPAARETGGHRVLPHRGVRNDRYKLIQFYGDGESWELFDLQADPNELRNVYGEPAYAGLTSDLKLELDRLRTQYRDVG